MAKTRKAHDDLFEGTTMTFGEHLEELRRSLFRGIIGIVIGCAIGFYIANDVVRFFQSPLERAMQRYYLDKALGDFGLSAGQVPIEVRRMIIDEGLIPEYLQIETAAVTRALGLNNPAAFGELELSPYSFTTGDFQADGARTLAQRVVAASEDEVDAPAHEIWTLLDKDQQQALQKLATAKGQFTVEQTAQVAALLNAVAGHRELHESKAMANVVGPEGGSVNSLTNRIAAYFGWTADSGPDTVTTLRKELKDKFNAEKSRRLNKLLIAGAFPASLHKARLNMVSITAWRTVKVRFQVLNAQEAFMIWMKAGLVTGLVIASPWLFFQIWNFVAAGLYPHEKNYVYLYLPISILLFVGGASLAFIFVFDPVLDFLFLFNKGMNADFDPRIGEWLGFVLILPVGFGVSFQLPLVMLFVNRIGLVTTETYIAQWRVAILTIFVVAMVLTPADPISMLLMALPLCGLFVVGILMCKFMPRGRNPFDEAYEP